MRVDLLAPEHEVLLVSVDDQLVRYGLVEFAQAVDDA